MSRTAEKVTAGLVFLGMRNFDIVRIGNRVCAALDRLDEQIAGFRVLSDTTVSLRTAFHALRIEIENDRTLPGLSQPAAHFISLTLMRPDPCACEETDLSLAIMAHALQTLHDALAPDYVQWVEPDALLTSADFRMATTLPEDEMAADYPEVSVAPAVAPEQPRRESLPDIEETNDALHARLIEKGSNGDRHSVEGALRAVFRDPSESARLQHATTGTSQASPEDDIREQTAPLRLAVWMFTIALGLIALPMALALTVFNLLRGENLRLTSQTAALSGTFVVLQATGSTAQAMQTVQLLLG